MEPDVLGWIAWGAFALGVVLATIGGMISFRMDYEVHNRDARLKFDPSGEPVRIDDPFELSKAMFGNRKARWWLIAGYGFAIVGFALTFLNMSLDGNYSWVGTLLAVALLFFISYWSFRRKRR